ncbi:hypothetical protein NQ318_016192 [Aromia moschata]|uniref:TROVE domain-containing protein n=1 Tax=Aromia moschata TaxID=1265417 RepID=A0AAV8YD12_9CUCU|nr:hypothetical protein NQ318_016192 [Aromia moschata]
MAASKLTNEDKLKRLIYLGNVDPKYISGGPDKYIPVTKAKQELLDEFVKNSANDLLRIILSASEDKLIPHRATLYNILACAMANEGISEKSKPEISATVLKICRSDKEFFDFIMYVTSLRTDKCKLPPTAAKTVRKYYTNKSAQDLVNSYTKYNSYHSWSHKDLIKLGHVKSDTPLKNIVINYILFKKNTEQEGDSEAKKLLDILKKSETLRSTKDHKVAVPIIAELKATINQVEPTLRKSAEVWNAVLPNMSLPEVLQVLPKLYKLGFLKKDTPTQAQINETLTNVEKVKASGVHPIEVFIAMKNFEKRWQKKLLLPIVVINYYFRPLDPKLLDHLVREKKLTEEEIKKLRTPNEAKCPVVINHLQKCMYISCNNVQSFGKRYMVTIDVTDKMDTPCLHNKNITSLEAAVAFAMCLMRVEKDVTVAVYKEKEVSIVHLDKKGQFYEHVQKLRESKSNYLVPVSAIEWASTQKKHIDIFFNFIHHKEYYTSIPKDVREKISRPSEALQKYRKKFNLQNTKLVTFCMSSPHVTFADGSPNMLDVAGLDLGVARAVEAFCRGNFS